MKEGLDDSEDRRVDRQRTDEDDKRRHHGVRQDAVPPAPALCFPGGHQCGWCYRCQRGPLTGDRAPMRWALPISLGRVRLSSQPPRLETCEVMALMALATLS